MLTADSIKIKKNTILVFDERFFLSSKKPIIKKKKDIIKKLEYSVVISKNISVKFL